MRFPWVILSRDRWDLLTEAAVAGKGTVSYEVGRKTDELYGRVQITEGRLELLMARDAVNTDAAQAYATLMSFVRSEVQAQGRRCDILDAHVSQLMVGDGRAAVTSRVGEMDDAGPYSEEETEPEATADDLDEFELTLEQSYGLDIGDPLAPPTVPEPALKT